MLFLQADTADELIKRLPTFSEMVGFYGPFLGLVLCLVTTFMFMQYVWFTKTLNAKDEEIKRAVAKDTQSNQLIEYMFKKQIGFKIKKNKKI